MLSSVDYIVAATAIVFVGVSCLKRQGDRSCPKKLPPGPRGLPLIGNVHQFPSHGIPNVLMTWGNQYGDLIYTRLFGSPMIFINSMEVAQDLLVKKSSIYSGRPYSVHFIELLGWDDILTFMTYGDRFRKHRKWIHDAIQEKRSLLSYRPLQQREVDTLLEGLMSTPQDFVVHFHRYAAALIMEVSYGHTVTSVDDKYIAIVEKALKITTESAVIGSMLVDFIPILKHLPTWMPGSGFKTKSLAARPHIRRVMDAPMEMVKRAVADGSARPSLVLSLLEQVGDNPDEEDDVKGAGAALYAAGTVTTLSVLSTFVLAMVLHPAVFAKVQKEVDRVVGPGNLPGFDDRESLPYLECVLREVYRWNIPLPLGLPHSVMADDHYRGYYIPNGARIIANLTAMSRDARFYPEPDTFRPERFEEMDRATLEERDPRRFVFGFGRRACPGLQFADTSIWLAAAQMVATLDIAAAHDAAGHEITPAARFTSNADSQPEPFVCDIRPRVVGH